MFHLLVHRYSQRNIDDRWSSQIVWWSRWWGKHELRKGAVIWNGAGWWGSLFAYRLLRIQVTVARLGAVLFISSLALCSLIAMNRGKTRVNTILEHGFWINSSVKAIVLEIKLSNAPKSLNRIFRLSTVMTW